VPPFVHKIRVRYNECDPQDVVFNANYLVYIDITVTELWREAFGSYDAMAADGLDLVVAEANVRFVNGAHFDDELDITATVEHLGTTSVTTRFDFNCDGEQIAVGHLRHVFVKLGGGKTPIPDRFREGLQRYATD
jgi:acyl-CoA thioester hydrolase